MRVIGIMYKFGHAICQALPASGFPPEGGRFTPLSPSAEKPESSARTWLRLCWSGFVALTAPSFLWTGARRESPPNGGGCGWWLSDRLYCAACWHRPLGINRPCAQALLSPALQKITRCCSALVRPAMKLRRGRNAANLSCSGSFRAWLRCD